MLCGDIINDTCSADTGKEVKIPVYIKAPGFYQYQKITPNTKFPFVGRYFEPNKVTDVVFNIAKTNNVPFVSNWDYCLDYSSTAAVTMGLISKIKELNKRKSPLYVATFLAANLDISNSEHGIIESNWTIKDFKPEEAPSRWANSSEIFRKYIIDKKAVKYGQCWVLAELLTTMLQFLGFHARSVKIENCLIDLHDVYGIDELNSDMFTVKSCPVSGHDSLRGLNISELINDDEINYCNDEFERCDVGEKCLDVITDKISDNKVEDVIEDDKIKDDSDDVIPCTDINLNHLIKPGKSWNYHVWVEFFALKQWWIVDPCPIEGIHVNTSADFNGKRFLGPVQLDVIKRNAGIGRDFRYLYAAVNGSIRHWDVFYKDNVPIFYLKDTLYDIPQVIAKEERKQVIKTSDYRSTSSSPDSYDYLHRHNPVLIVWKDNKFSFIKRNLIPNTEYIVQICLFYDKILLSCVRKKVTTLDNIQLYDPRANKLTFIILNLTTKKWYSQMLKF